MNEINKKLILKKMRQQKFYLKQISLCLMLTFIFGLLQVQAQNSKVTGKVVDENGKGMPGATVVVEGSSVGTATDNDGLFSLVVNSDAVLLIKYISYTAQKVKVAGKRVINVQMVPSVDLLQETVVIGYQTVSKRNVSASVASISGKDLANIPAASLDVMLQGRLSGVNIQNISGEPGSRQSFTVRGNTAISRGDEFYSTSDPLYVIDGVVSDYKTATNFSTSNTSFIAGLSPSDIASIDVLKDASAAAIYGSRAANGVVIITTKRGQSGKTQVSYNSYYGFTQSPSLPAIFTGAAERRGRMNQIYSAGNYFQVRNNPLLLTDSLNPAFNNNTNWMGMFYRNGIVQNHDVSMTGGTDKSNYRVSAGYYDEKGTVVGNGFKRYTINSRLFNTIGSWMEVNTNFYYSNVKTNPVTGGGSRNITTLNPSNIPSSLLYLSDADKATYMGLNTSMRDDNNQNSLTLSNNILIKFNKKFNFRSNISYNLNNSRRDQFVPSTTNTSQIANASSNSVNYNKITAENLFNYSDTYGKNHKLLVMLGQSVETENGSNTYLGGNYIPTDQITTVNGVTATNMSGNSSRSAAAMLSYFTQVTYMFKDRYNLSLSERMDGSSRFGPERRWGSFPSASVNWIISDEPFAMRMKNVVDLMKLRASYGVNGSQPSDFYGYYNKYAVKGSFPGSSGVTNSYNGVTAIGPDWNGIAQDKLTWEESRQWNFGMDVELMKNRFNMSFDIYNRETHGIRFDFPMPLTSGYGTYYTNAASIRNAGAEFSIFARLLKPESKFRWNINFNVSHNKNTIIELPNGNQPIQVGDWVLVTGQPLNQYYMYNYQGVYHTASEIPTNPLTGNPYGNLWGNAFHVGDSKYEDIVGDYSFDPWSSKDRKSMGDPNPKFTGGFVNDFFYKNWTLSVQCSYVLGRDIYNASLASSLSNDPSGADEDGNGFSSNYTTSGTFLSQYTSGHFYGPEDFIARRALLSTGNVNIWSKNNPNNATTTFPNNSPYAMQYNYPNFSSLFVENGSYLKINRITLGYNFTSPRLAKIGIERLRLSSSLENVHIFKAKNCLVADPELVDAKGFYSGTGYALARKCTFSLEVTF